MGLKAWSEIMRVWPMQISGRPKILLSFDERLPWNAEDFDFILLDESTPETANKLQRMLDKKIQESRKK
jgi:hypothetical protein